MTNVIIVIRTSRDNWSTPQVTIDQLYSTDVNQPVLIDLNNEGISLQASGILKAINQWVVDTGRDPASITIKTPNFFEKTGYRTIGSHHFFNASRISQYYTLPTAIDPQSKLFAFFVGSYTVDRGYIAQDIYDHYLDKFLISVMRTTSQDVIWDPHIWNLGSIDNLTVQDQYRPEINTVSSLLKFYNQFQIELVAETTTRGISFFPTEKTVRAIVGGRPFITFGPVDFLKNLQELGFCTFSELWNEDYDLLEGPARWIAIRSTIEKIITNGYDCNLAQDIVKYNNYCLEQKMAQNRAGRMWQQYPNNL
jgi:hypothetical protein